MPSTQPNAQKENQRDRQTQLCIMWWWW